VQVCGLKRESSILDRLAGMPSLSLYDMHDRSVAELRRIIEDCRPDVVFNLAARGVSSGDLDPVHAYQVNVELAVNLMQAIAGRPPIGLIHVGSCFEYGAGCDDDYLSETAAGVPFSFYGATKLAGTIMVSALARQLKIRSAILRLFGVYGPGEGRQRFVPYVIERLADRKTAELTSGLQVRDLVFIDDIANAIYIAGCKLGDLNLGEIYNVGSGRGVSFREVGETIAANMNRPSSLLRWGAHPARAGEPSRIVANNQKFCDATGWQPQIPLSTGLRMSIDAMACISATTTAAA